MKVSLAFIRNFLLRYRETGDIEAKRQRGERRFKIKGKHENFLQKLVREQNNIDLRKVQGSLLCRTGIEVSKSNFCRQLKRLKLGLKKSLIPSELLSEKAQKLRYEWRIWLDSIDVRNIVFIDETGVNLVAGAKVWQM